LANLTCSVIPPSILGKLAMVWEVLKTLESDTSELIVLTTSQLCSFGKSAVLKPSFINCHTTSIYLKEYFER
jgi:hypothetical protein